MFNIDTFLSSRSITRVAAPLLVTLLALSTYANPLDAIAPNGVLIDSTCVLTALKPQSQIPKSVSIAGKEYRVIATKKHPYLSHILLFLDQPITNVEPITRYRADIEKYLAKSPEIDIFVSTKSAEHLEDEVLLDFSRQKRLGHRFVACESINMSVPEITETINATAINNISIDPILKQELSLNDLLVENQNICIGSGYYIRNSDEQYQLIGIKTCVEDRNQDWFKLVIHEAIHDTQINGFIDSCIVEDALKAPGSSSFQEDSDGKHKTSTTTLKQVTKNIVKRSGIDISDEEFDEEDLQKFHAILASLTHKKHNKEKILLPDEVLLHILNQDTLTIKDVPALAQTSSHFNRLTREPSFIAKKIALLLRKGITPEKLSEIIKSLEQKKVLGWEKKIRSITLIPSSSSHTSSILGEAFNLLKRFTNLNYLDLKDCYAVNDSHMMHLEGLPLRQLYLEKCTQITDRGLQSLSKMPLEILDLSYTQITDKGIEFLRELPLRKLYLEHCHQISDTSMEHISKMSLVILDLGYCTRITNRGITALHKMPLTWLFLSGCTQVTDFTSKVFSGLIQLDLDHCDTITNRNVKEIARNCPKLIKLSLIGCNHITDLRQIANEYPNLTILTLKGNPFQ